jgi:hypothetical protein
MEQTALKTHWFSSPSEHWFSGLLSEIATFLGFLVFVWLVALGIMWVW